MRWDPGSYLRFTDERARPFHDLVARVGAEAPSRVVDLGCGPGTLTRELARRWPDAAVLGLDSSPEMIAEAQALAIPARLEFAVGDLREWEPAEPVDVLVTNATLQWVPGHLDLLPQLTGHVRAGGWFAAQLPGNFGEPAHTAIDALLGEPRWRERFADVVLARPASAEPADYLAVLAEEASVVDVWETTYLHVLTGPDAVVRWMSGTGLRPVLSALADTDADEFLAAYRERVAPHYPAQPWGTVLPYWRIFLVAQR